MRSLDTDRCSYIPFCLSHQSTCSHDFCSNIRPFLLAICLLQQVISWCKLHFTLIFTNIVNIIFVCRGCLQRLMKGQEQWFEDYRILALWNDCHFVMYKYFKQRSTDYPFAFSNPLSFPFSDVAFLEFMSHGRSRCVLSQVSRRDHATYMTRRDAKSPLVIIQNFPFTVVGQEKGKTMSAK